MVGAENVFPDEAQFVMFVVGVISCVRLGHDSPSSCLMLRATALALRAIYQLQPAIY
jgi:hypothetical protein